jgi:hypothetical protein
MYWGKRRGLDTFADVSSQCRRLGFPMQATLRSVQTILVLPFSKKGTSLFFYFAVLPYFACCIAPTVKGNSNEMMDVCEVLLANRSLDMLREFLKRGIGSEDESVPHCATVASRSVSLLACRRTHIPLCDSLFSPY